MRTLYVLRTHALLTPYGGEKVHRMCAVWAPRRNVAERTPLHSGVLRTGGALEAHHNAVAVPW